MDARQKKQIKAGAIFIAVFLVLILSIYFMFKPAPTCNDEIKNQGEENVDCGGPCAVCVKDLVTVPLEVLSTEWVFYSENKYDLVIKIKNPNSQIGAVSFSYTIEIIDENGAQMAVREEKSAYILPSEEKFLLISAIELSKRPTNIKAIVKETVWNKFEKYERPDFVLNNVRYEVLSGGTAGFSKVSGNLINKAPYDLEKIETHVFLRDAQGTLLATNAQLLNTVRSGEQRDFTMSFPHSFPGSVTKVEVVAYSNIFNLENYINLQGQPDQQDRQ